MTVKCFSVGFNPVDTNEILFRYFRYLVRLFKQPEMYGSTYSY